MSAGSQALLSPDKKGLLSSLLGPGGECEGFALRLVGHSLGGAIATLTGLRVCSHLERPIFFLYEMRLPLILWLLYFLSFDLCQLLVAYDQLEKGFSPNCCYFSSLLSWIP